MVRSGNSWIILCIVDNMENLGLGLVLMIVGMLTVFLILLIVIFGSTLMIRIVNKISPAEAGKSASVPEADDPLTRQVLEAALTVPSVTISEKKKDDLLVCGSAMTML